MRLVKIAEDGSYVIYAIPREVLVENLVDPSHLPFAHSGVLNRR